MNNLRTMMTMKTLLKAVLTLALLLGFCGVSHAQLAVNYTTLSSAVTGPTVYSGLPGPGPIQFNIAVASVTNINGFGSTGQQVQGTLLASNSQYTTLLLIDNELMAVQTVNTSAKTLTVIRGWEGTMITPHVSGAIVIAAPPQAFAASDPFGQCTASGTPATPLINEHTGRQWICDSTTGDWLPVLSTGSITPAATSAAIQTTAQTFTLNGVITGEPISLFMGPAPTSLCPLVQARVTATNTVSLYFTTLTAAACTPAAGTYMFLAPLHYTVTGTGKG